jgi:hypothetical protein
MAVATCPALSHDFDFMVGRWKVHNRFLNGRLCGSRLWIEFEATYEFSLLLDGIGNIDQFHSEHDGKKVEGITLRLFDPVTGDWTLYWADNMRPGRLLPPMVGRFHGDVGEFYGDEEVDGRAVRCRFRWHRDAEHPRWEQAFSDDGENWETNWIMSFTRDRS